jgi:hypothetical protein
MEDLDLDELDQQVTKMMDRPKGKRSKRQASASVSSPVAARKDVAVSVSVTPPAQPSSESNMHAQEEPSMPEPRQPEPTRVTVNRPVRVPERRRTHPGAMDIIQPAAVPKAPSARAGREAPSLQPTSQVAPEPTQPVAAPQHEPIALPDPVTPELSVPEKPAPAAPHDDVSDEVLASLSMIDEPQAPKITDEPPKSKPAPTGKSSDGWPDPLDFHDFGDEPSADPSKAPAHSADALLADEPAGEPKEMPPTMDTEPVSVTDRHDDAAVSSSPFLTTKVEKRPLGAYAATAPAVTEPAQPAVLPQTDNQVPHEDTSKHEMAEASFESKQHLNEPEDMDSLRQMAIPQQYQAAAHQPKEDVRPVFDTKEYHAAPQHMHAAHKSSPWVAVSIVVLVVLIIAALLVGYFMMTGTFDITTLW